MGNPGFVERMGQPYQRNPEEKLASCATEDGEIVLFFCEGARGVASGMIPGACGKGGFYFPLLP